MQPQNTLTESSEGIPQSVVLRWVMKAALFGLLVGAWAGFAALRAG
jgi:hypothetical protein